MSGKYLFRATYLAPIADPHKKERISCCILAENYGQAEDYFERERKDPEVEFEALERLDPVVAIIDDSNRKCRALPTQPHPATQEETKP